MEMQIHDNHFSRKVVPVDSLMVQIHSIAVHFWIAAFIFLSHCFLCGKVPKNVIIVILFFSCQGR